IRERRMRTVDIADDVYAALQRMAVPFEDDINDVLRRLLRDRRPSHPSNSSNGNGALRPGPTVEARVEGSARDEPVTEPPTGDTVIVHRRAAPSEQHLPQTTFRSAVVGVLRASREPVAISELLTSVERLLGD